MFSLGWLARGVDFLAASLAAVAKVALAIIVVGVTADALGRYVFSMPLRGAYVFVEGLLLPSVIFLACALNGRRASHMTVDLLQLERWPRVYRAREIAFSILISGFWAFCAWRAGSVAYSSFVAGRWPVGELAVPSIVSYGIVAIGCTAAAIAHIVPRSAVEAENDDAH